MSIAIGFAGILIGIVSTIWSIWHQTRVVKEVQHQIYRLSTELDQSVQRLQRMRNVVLELHKVEAYLTYLQQEQEINYSDPTIVCKLAEQSAYTAELHGLAFAIDDKELLSVVTAVPYFIRVRIDRGEWDPTRDEADLRFRSQKLHKRIGQLLIEATKNNKVDSPQPRRKEHA